MRWPPLAKAANPAAMSNGDAPPLPAAKRGAIARLGFGVMDKVVMVFKRAFWGPDPNTPFIGHAPARGGGGGGAAIGSVGGDGAIGGGGAGGGAAGARVPGGAFVMGAGGA